MKIVHVLTPARAGGLERVVHALAIGQRRVGHDVVVVAITDEWTPDHPFNAPLARAGVELVPLIVPTRAYLRERADLSSLFRQRAPDVMHSHGYHTDVVCGDVARRAHVATVSTAHGFTRGAWRNRVYEALDRLALRHFDAVAAVSQPLADELIRSGVARDRVHVVPNGWSTVSVPLDRGSARQELGLAPDVFVVGWVGRMTREKGLDVFVDALALLRDLPLKACIAGAGPDREIEERRAQDLGLSERIHWVGPLREAARCFSGFDMLALSSRTEGVPMVVLEAMSAKVPLVVTSVGGIPDVVSTEQAILVGAERPADLAAGIRSVFENRDAAAQRAASAARRLESEFAEGPWLQSYDRVYASARGRRPRR